ncbi:MAG: hypothetical protein NZM06_05080 [Chloroherpetonaceae bacterium]|nr:hypothetical protein [Chloroherpetonaceae bacterium]MDW8437955.1 hypothetical protein [Chloroherpetonaceae bacterium]
MIKNPSLRAIFALLVLLSFLRPVVAQEKPLRALGGGFAREIALGAGAAYSPTHPYNFNPFLRNDTYLLINPAYIGDFGNYVWGNFDGTQTGATSQTFAGANFEALTNLYLGLLVNTRDALATTGQLNDYAGQRLPNIENALGFLIGYKLSPELTLGAQIYTGAQTFEAKLQPAGAQASDTTRQMSVLGFDVGAVYNSAQWRGELAIKVRMNSRLERSRSTTTAEVSLDGGMELGANGRVFYKLSDAYDLVPTFSFYNVSIGTKVAPAPPANAEKVDVSQTAFEVGLGLNAKTKNALIIGGVSFAQSTIETKTTNLGNAAGNSRTETDQTTLLPRINLGAELYPLSWLTARVGYFKTLASNQVVVEQRIGGNVSKVTQTTNGLTFANYLGDHIAAGVGLRFSEWTMDFALNKDFLRNGPHALGGVATSPLFFVFSSSYRF